MSYRDLFYNSLYDITMSYRMETIAHGLELGIARMAAI